MTPAPNDIASHAADLAVVRPFAGQPVNSMTSLQRQSFYRLVDVGLAYRAFDKADDRLDVIISGRVAVQADLFRGESS